MPPKNDKTDNNVKGNSKYLVISIIFLGVLIAVSSFLVYYKLTNDYEAKINALNTKLSSDLVSTKDSLISEINKEKTFSAEQRAMLEKKTLENFEKVQAQFNLETSKLKLNLESQLSNVASDVQTVKTQTESGLQDISKKVGSLEDISEALQGKISDLNVQSSDFSSIVEEVIKAVVSIKTNIGQGSGVIFDSRGYIITNKHVIEGATSIKAVDHNANQYTAALKGIATNADLAVLKIEGSFDHLNFADMSTVKVGSRAIAVGNPLGLSFSVTEGIVSALNRVIDDTGVGYLQTDVSINPGNSGGPLVNSAKEIIGINTLKLGNTEGLGFAIPANVVESIADQAVG